MARALQLASPMQQPWIVISAMRDANVTDALACADMLTSQDRVVVVATADNVESVTAQLEWHPPDNILVPLRDLGDASELLYPLARVLASDPLASLVYLPADYRGAPPAVLADAIRTAWYATNDQQLAILTAPGRASGPGGAPPIAAGLVTAFWDQMRRALPSYATQLETYVEAIATPSEADVLATTFAHLEPATLVRGLLVGAQRLAHVPLDHALEMRVLGVAAAPARAAA